MDLMILWDKFTELNNGNIFVLIVVIASLIQVSPIKFNPWTWLGCKVREALGLNEIKSDLMDSRRTRIIRFDDELIEKRPHRKDMFDAILVDCDKYEKFCKANKGYVNSVADDSIKHIKEVYAEFKRTNGFLTDNGKEEK